MRRLTLPSPLPPDQTPNEPLDKVMVVLILLIALRLVGGC
jgi:hypothetical protein